MRFAKKIVLGTAAALLVTAAGFPHQIAAIYHSSYPADPHKAHALALCQQDNSSFIRFLPSERADCYARMRTVVGDNTGIWSRHDRSVMHLAQLTHSQLTR